MTIRVMLVDDHAVVRTGYRRLVDAEPDMHMVAAVATADEACATLRENEIDVVVMDLSLREGSGLETIRRLLERKPELRILVFSMHQSVGYATQALRNGAIGYITKNSEPLEMIDAIRKTFQGQRTFSPEIAHALACQAVEGAGALECLTPREFEILRLVAGGVAPTSVGEQLHLSPKTVLNHLSNIRRKLNVNSELELLLLAARHGLVNLPSENRVDGSA
ncbi:response regulator transcription factor [uncultured Azohydromonas sp.]|jgi:Response regulator containing a CheY-like receiver domain and an HTH DNA-binding domain|uniref:response regulator n=1 Tax=uncultured Azohydromonas sp. TaxID=487342 RepID=UPI00260F3AAE|nr:response regulator transcription factor [uncultured Azohydromonas sp.]